MAFFLSHRQRINGVMWLSSASEQVYSTVFVLSLRVVESLLGAVWQGCCLWRSCSICVPQVWKDRGVVWNIHGSMIIDQEGLFLRPIGYWALTIEAKFFLPVIYMFFHGESNLTYRSRIADGLDCRSLCHRSLLTLEQIIQTDRVCL